MWSDFHEEVDSLGPESEQLLHNLFTTDDERELDFLQRDKVRLERSRDLVLPTERRKPPPASKSEEANSSFAKLSSTPMGVRCCISGINVPRLLVASHIKPWAKFPNERLNPRNGLCLSSLHDAAFDGGLITLDKEMRLVLSKRLKGYFPQAVLEASFLAFEGKPISLPRKIAEPDLAFLWHHRARSFRS